MLILFAGPLATAQGTVQYMDMDADGDFFYYKDKDCKILHREDGPAMVCHDGYKEWYLDGVMYLEDEWKKKITEVE